MQNCRLKIAISLYKYIFSISIPLSGELETGLLSFNSNLMIIELHCSYDERT